MLLIKQKEPCTLKKEIMADLVDSFKNHKNLAKFLSKILPFR